VDRLSPEQQLAGQQCPVEPAPPECLGLRHRCSAELVVEHPGSPITWPG
jgi:hypothetical protein